MDHLTDHLNALNPLFHRLSHGDDELCDELQQRVAVELLERGDQNQPTNRGVAIGIAKHVACDIVSERRKWRQRFVLNSDLEVVAGNPDVLTPDNVFATAWERLCCPSLKRSTWQWRKTLSPQVRPALRGLRRGMTQAQVAAAEGVPPGTVASWAHRARRSFKRVLPA